MIAFIALFWMLVGHALADYPLQGEFLAQAKNRHTAIGAQFWLWALPAHALIHGGAVALAIRLSVHDVPGFSADELSAFAVALGLCEACLHAWIDFMKCEGRIDLHDDQLAHIACKIAWAMALLGMA